MTEFCPILWQEEPAPEAYINCGECGLDQHGSRLIWGEGNPNASIMILLDNPGAREDREGNPFICGTRQTLQKAAKEAGLAKEDLYVTYILKRKPVRAYDKDEVRKTCMMHLNQQLSVKMPELILCLGNVAVQSFFQDSEVNVKQLHGKLHKVHGYHTTASYHPLAVRRRPNLWPTFIKDWKYLADTYRNSFK